MHLTICVAVLVLFQVQMTGSTIKMISNQELVKLNLKGLSGDTLKESKKNAQDSDQLIIKAMGRPFSLGGLYDAVTDNLLPGYKPWFESTIEKNTLYQRSPDMDYKLDTAETKMEKCQLFNMGASISASFAGGLFKVSGAANYLTESVRSNYEASVTYYRKEHTHHKLMELSKFKTLDVPTVFDDKSPSATHVVTAIWYGGDAFIRFSKMVTHKEDKTDMDGQLNAHANFVIAEAHGDAKINISKSDKEKFSRISCHFTGDVELASTPTTLLDFAEIAQQMGGLINESTAVPLLITLQPINKFKSKWNRIVVKIEDDIFNDILNKMNKDDEEERGIVDLTTTATYLRLPHFKHQVDQLMTALRHKRRHLEATMAKYIPLLRQGDLESRQKAANELRPFLEETNTRYTKVLVMWMVDGMMKEAMTLNRFINTKSVSNMILTNEGAFEEVLYDLETDYIVALVIKLYKAEEKFTQCMVRSCELDDKRPECKEICHTGRIYSSWFYAVYGLKNRIRSTTKGFIGMVGKESKNTQLVIKPELLEPKQTPFVKIRVYSDGDVITDDFLAPTLTVKYETKKDCSGTILSYRVSNKKDMNQETIDLLEEVIIEYFSLATPDYVRTEVSKGLMGLDYDNTYELPYARDFQVSLAVKCKFGICSEVTKKRGTLSEECKKKSDDIANKWELTVKTSSEPYADSSNDVYVMIMGSNGKSGNVWLGNGTEYKRNSINKFALMTNDVGYVDNVTVGVTKDDGWLMNEAWLISITKGIKYHLPLNLWLDTDKEDDAENHYLLEPDKESLA